MIAIAHPLADRGDDVYDTPDVAVEALLSAETIPGCVWEPACGPGAIARVLRRHGRVVYAIDFVDYDSRIRTSRVGISRSRGQEEVISFAEAYSLRVS